MQRTTCSNCGEAIDNDFSRKFYSMFRFCQKCSHPSLTAERENLVKEAMKAEEPVIEKVAEIIINEKEIEKQIEEIDKIVSEETKSEKIKKFVSKVLK